MVVTGFRAGGDYLGPGAGVGPFPFGDPVVLAADQSPVPAACQFRRRVEMDGAVVVVAAAPGTPSG